MQTTAPLPASGRRRGGRRDRARHGSSGDQRAGRPGVGARRGAGRPPHVRWPVEQQQVMARISSQRSQDRRDAPTPNWEIGSGAEGRPPSLTLAADRRGLPQALYSGGCSPRSLAIVRSMMSIVSATDRPFSSAAAFRSSYMMFDRPIWRWASMQPQVRHMPAEGSKNRAVQRGESRAPSVCLAWHTLCASGCRRLGRWRRYPG